MNPARPAGGRRLLANDNKDKETQPFEQGVVADGTGQAQCQRDRRNRRLTLRIRGNKPIDFVFIGCRNSFMNPGLEPGQYRKSCRWPTPVGEARYQKGRS